MILGVEWAVIRRHGWRLGWRQLPLTVRTYLVGVVLVNGATALAIGLAIGGALPTQLLGAVPPGQDAPSGVWIMNNLAFILSALFSFAGSTAVALWRLNILERDTATKDSLNAGLALLSKDHAMLRETLTSNTRAHDELAVELKALREELKEEVRGMLLGLSDNKLAIARIEATDAVERGERAAERVAERTTRRRGGANG